ncbi:MAG: cytidine/deoxycytidylate deaminase family protein [archaeon]|nr:cytidine/deoxycytidylate deaminase family protein [archaeon]MCR4323772.1 cytidine/deoxycytidylate deaminase family protein [Nanoarchaeota archaeon]
MGNGSEKFTRPTWDEYFMDIAETVAKRATCDRGRSGCVIAKNKQILVTGYVGSPKGLPHCDEVGHQMEEWIHSDGIKRMHCVRTTHAEQNAICQAAKLGIPIEGATIYCKMVPCQVCAKMIVNTGIKRVVCEKIYHAGGETGKLFQQAGIQLEVLNHEIENYEGQ